MCNVKQKANNSEGSKLSLLLFAIKNNFKMYKCWCLWCILSWMAFVTFLCLCVIWATWENSAFWFLFFLTTFIFFSVLRMRAFVLCRCFFFMMFSFFSKPVCEAPIFKKHSEADSNSIFCPSTKLLFLVWS